SRRLREFELRLQRLRRRLAEFSKALHLRFAPGRLGRSPHGALSKTPQDGAGGAAVAARTHAIVLIRGCSAGGATVRRAALRVDHAAAHAARNRADAPLKPLAADGVLEWALRAPAGFFQHRAIAELD